MTRMLTRVRDLEWLQAQRDEALKQRFIAEAAFAEITAIYYRRYPGDTVTAEIQALANPSLRKAQADAAWYGAKAEMLAAVLTSRGGS